jgi:hypothetical protein
VLCEVNAFGRMLVRLGFTEDAAKYMVRQAGLDSLPEVGYLDDDDDVEHLCKRVNRPVGSSTVGTAVCEVSSRTRNDLLWLSQAALGWLSCMGSTCAVPC